MSISVWVEDQSCHNIILNIRNSKYSNKKILYVFIKSIKSKI